MDELVAKHGFLIGSILLALAVLYIGSHITGAVSTLGNEIRKSRESRANDELLASMARSLECVAENVESLHRLFGGRQWKRDEGDEYLDGPTMQHLLQSISENLNAKATVEPHGHNPSPSRVLIVPDQRR